MVKQPWSGEQPILMLAPMQSLANQALEQQYQGLAGQEVTAKVVARPDVAYLQSFKEHHRTR